METNTYQRFNRSIDSIFENTEDLDLTTELGKLITDFILYQTQRSLRKITISLIKILFNISFIF